MNCIKKIGTLLFVFTCLNGLIAQTIPLYKNPAKPIPERVKDLIARMNPEEKFWQLFMIPGEIKAGEEALYKNGLFGFQVSASTAANNASEQILQYAVNEDAISLAKKVNRIQKYFVEETRLGIPMIAFDEALHGLVRSGATVFPQSIALAASWDTTLMQEVANAIATETKLRGIRHILSPVINLATDTRWGRTEETYGEDAFLSSAMGVAYMGAFERKNIITTPKHFIANVGEGGRDSYPIHWNERKLYENDFIPFIDAIKKAGARSIMTAYNSLDGSPSSANNWLLNTTLKKQWGFKGFVLSDASAVGGANVLHNTSGSYAESGKQSLIGGLDVIFQTAHEHGKLFIQPFLDGSIPAAVIDEALNRVLTAKFELGLFENPYVAENNNDTNLYQQHRTLAKKAAIESIVLLKNEAHTLPIQSSIKSIAVIGSDAKEARLGGYSGPGIQKVSIWQGLQQMAADKKISINYAVGSTRLDQSIQTIPSGQLSFIQNGQKITGLAASYFTNINASGKPALNRIDPQVDFNWTLYPPDNALQSDFYSAKWEGEFTSPITGYYAIGLKGNDGYRLYIQNKLWIDRWDKTSFHTDLVELSFEKNKHYPIRIEFKEPNGNAHIQLIWKLPDTGDKKRMDAIALAKKSDLIIYTAGIEEGEFRDRSSLSLPGNQVPVLKELIATGKPVVVLLVGGSAITMKDWLPGVKAVVDCWYPGEMGGQAVADILFGAANPGGKLPISFVQTEGQLPLVYKHLPTGRGDDYLDLSGLPQFPFGYGLSYTHFKYSNLQMDKHRMQAADSATIQFQLENDGSFDGDEVVQLYIRDEIASLARPVMELKGFQRVFLKKGEKKTIRFTVNKEQLEMYDLQMNKVVEPGNFRIMIGASSRDLQLKDILTIY